MLTGKKSGSPVMGIPISTLTPLMNWCASPWKDYPLYISCVYLFHVVSYSAPNGVVNGVVNLRFLALFQ
ncbi:hypothetical protein DIV06_19155 [Escherichia coli]|nr:hypothetical protein [Escherichia coli]PBQ41349.1 hypothetical protein COD56_18490 [Escherichia coli]PBR34950.1 hypothetical protein COD54_17025 [Escherichia coli]PZY57865.1 hypothetical protein DIV06_19155 [Escherichia coli]TIY75172.1 hypothetical protein C9349_20525 [Escherichia coli]